MSLPRWVYINNRFRCQSVTQQYLKRCVRISLFHWTFYLRGRSIIIIIIICYLQGIYTHIPETNYVPREYSVTAIMLLLFVVLLSLVSVLNLLYFVIFVIIIIIIIIIIIVITIITYVHVREVGRPVNPNCGSPDRLRLSANLTPV